MIKNDLTPQNWESIKVQNKGKKQNEKEYIN
jgi:hypothetical protein